MVDISELIHPVAELYRRIFDMTILIYGNSITIGSLVMWTIVGGVFLHYFRKWIDA